MYQYAIFPFVIQQEPLEDLPVEMAATVLRYLDGVSLLNAAKSSRRLMNICRGDPILRERVEVQLKTEMAARRQYYLNPSASVTVARQTKRQVFQRNAVKHVRVNPQPPPVENLEELWTSKRPAGGGKIKTKRTKIASRKGVRI